MEAAGGVGTGKTAPPPDGIVVLHDFHCLKISSTSSSNRSVSQMNESSPSTSSTSMISIARQYPPGHGQPVSTAMIRTRYWQNHPILAAMIGRFATPLYRTYIKPDFFLHFLRCNRLSFLHLSHFLIVPEYTYEMHLSVLRRKNMIFTKIKLPSRRFGSTRYKLK